MRENFIQAGYTGYNDDELMEIIDTHFFQPDNRRFEEFNTLDKGREDLIP